MKSHSFTILNLAILGVLICSSSHAQNIANESADIDIELVVEHREEGRGGGSVTHSRKIKELAATPLVHTLTGQDGRSSVATISYVGYAKFQIAKNTEGVQLTPGHVFAVQVFSGKKGVTTKTSERNVTKLVVYQRSPQIVYKDESVVLTIRDKK